MSRLGQRSNAPKSFRFPLHCATGDAGCGGDGTTARQDGTNPALGPAWSPSWRSGGLSSGQEPLPLLCRLRHSLRTAWCRSIDGRGGWACRAVCISVNRHSLPHASRFVSGLLGPRSARRVLGEGPDDSTRAMPDPSAVPEFLPPAAFRPIGRSGVLVRGSVTHRANVIISSVGVQSCARLLAPLGPLAAGWYIQELLLCWVLVLDSGR